MGGVCDDPNDEEGHIMRLCRLGCRMAFHIYRDRLMRLVKLGLSLDR